MVIRVVVCRGERYDRLFTNIFVAGHKIEQIPEVPLVLSDKVEEYKRTKDAVQLLKRMKVWPDIEKVMKMSSWLSRLIFLATLR